MLLEDIKPLHGRFRVGDLAFKATDYDSDNNKVFFAIQDDSGLEVGRFCASCCDNSSAIEYDDSEDDGTLERLRKTGYSDTIARNVRRAIDSMYD